MSDITLTDELRQMNRCWTLLVGLVNESMAILTDEDRSPEARLERLRQRLELAQRYTRDLPPSVRAELDADPIVQAALTAMAHEREGPHVASLLMGHDGAFHAVIDGPESGVRPLTDAEVQAILREEEVE